MHSLSAARAPSLNILCCLNRWGTPSTIKQQQQVRLSPRIRCAATTQTPARRSANYHPNLWTDDFIRSLAINHAREEDDQEGNLARINTLKEKVKELLAKHAKKKDLAELLRLIDHLQQLGVAYHFKDELKDALGSIRASLEKTTASLLRDNNLHDAALLFRLLRENGFSASEDMLKGFIDETGDEKAADDRIRQHSTRAVLSLYEASFYGKEGELLLEGAMDSTTKHLRCLMETEGSTALEDAEAYYLREHVARALELPLNWRMQRLQTKWLIQMCQGKPTVDPLVLEFAKRDFNAVQKIHRRELAQLSRWWQSLDLPRKLPFFRDRLAENYLWSVGWAYEPEHWAYREIQTKANCFITMIDDVYDVFGTLDELELFTEAIDRWDVNAITKLPEYMKMCFLAVFNAANDAAYTVMKEKGLDIVPYLRRAWADLCKSYLLEAKWYNKKYTPKLDEYLDNGWISISGLVSLTHAYCMSNDLTKDALESFSNFPPISRSSSMLLRLYDDLATASAEIERGDVSKSIQCCMQERDVSEAVARRHIQELIKKNWRELNGERTTSCSFEQNFKNVAVNIPRMSQFIYQNGDGYGIADGETKKQVLSLLIEPIKL